jgi:predicted tellurium resistance membrane protein TerC
VDYLFSLALDPTVWAALAALITMEVVLGIDNLVFISILTHGHDQLIRAPAFKAGPSPPRLGSR